MATGIYVRVRRMKKWVNEEFDQLIDSEMDEFITRSIKENSNPKDGWGWAKTLAIWIRDNVHETVRSE